MAARLRRFLGFGKPDEETAERICDDNVRLALLICPVVSLCAVLAVVAYFTLLPAWGIAFGDPYVLVFVTLLLLMASLMLGIVAWRYRTGRNTNRTSLYSYLAFFLAIACAYAIAFSAMSYAAFGRMGTLYVFLIIGSVIFVLHPIAQLALAVVALGVFFTVFGIQGLGDPALVLSCLCVTAVIVFAGMLRYGEQLRSVRTSLRTDTASKTDALTGLGNRTAFDADCLGFVDHGLIVAMVDVDDFKHFNDTYSHETGDEVLKKVARAILQSFPEGHAYRFGGDEFLIVCTDTRNEPRFREFSKRFMGAVRAIRIEDDKTEIIGTSLGYAIGKPHNGLELEDLLRLADAMLYEAKGAGKGCYRGAPLTRENLSAVADIRNVRAGAESIRSAEGVPNSPGC